MLCRLCCIECLFFEYLYDKDDQENYKFKTCQKFFFREMEKLDNTLNVCSKIICSDCWKAIYEFNEFYEKVIVQQTDYCNMIIASKSLELPAFTDSFKVEKDEVESAFVIDDAFIRESLVEKPKNCGVEDDSHNIDTLVSSIPNGSAKHIKVNGLNESPTEIKVEDCFIVDGGENEIIELSDDDASQSLSNSIPLEDFSEGSDNESKDQKKAFSSSNSKKFQAKRSKKTKKIHKRFECPICHRCFAYNRNLVEHYRTHKVTNDQSHKCLKSDKRFSCSKNLNTHYKKKYTGNDSKWICDLCAAKASSYENLEIHKKTRLCIIRQKKIEKKVIWDKASQIIKKINDGSWEPIFRCDLCEYSSDRCMLFKNHYEESHPDNLDSHNYRNPYECEFCHRRVRDKNNLQRHLYSHGDSTNTYECPHCGIGFSKKQSVSRHIGSFHPESAYDLCVTTRPSNCKFSKHKDKTKRRRGRPKKPVEDKLDCVENSKESPLAIWKNGSAMKRRRGRPKKPEGDKLAISKIGSTNESLLKAESVDSCDKSGAHLSIDQSLQQPIEDAMCDMSPEEHGMDVNNKPSNEPFFDDVDSDFIFDDWTC